MHLFNPENDLALANFKPNYTPPASAVRMARELAVFPIWYAGEEMTNGTSPIVIAEGEDNRAFVDKMKETLPLQATLVPFSAIAMYPDDPIVSWGWNPSLVRRLRAYGASESQLPSLEEMDRLRGYSNRVHAVEVLRKLRLLETKGFTGESRFFLEIEELLAYLKSLPGDKVLKMPLSGSGKGLVWILGGITDKQTDWCRRVIREQGGVVAELVMERVKDFAMEFYLDHGKTRFAGYSLFRTANSGAYMGNELLTDSRVEEVLSHYTSPELLHRLKDYLLKELSSRFPFYRGYAGVDMMICNTADGYKVHPCVEINVRMNMGVASRIFHERFVCPGREGMFAIDYFKKPGEALSFYREMEREHPLVVEHEKVSSGYLPMTPVTAGTRYVAYAIITR
jgi:hypothetical protein